MMVANRKHANTTFGCAPRGTVSEPFFSECNLFNKRSHAHMTAFLAECSVKERWVGG